jgi:hypothetical protein
MGDSGIDVWMIDAWAQTVDSFPPIWTDIIFSTLSTLKPSFRRAIVGAIHVFNIVVSYTIIMCYFPFKVFLRELCAV